MLWLINIMKNSKRLYFSIKKDHSGKWPSRNISIPLYHHNVELALLYRFFSGRILIAWRKKSKTCLKEGEIMTKLLLNEKPLIVMPGLAVKIGLNESIFIQQLHYWLDKSTNVKEGHRWVYNSAKEWQKQFPFWSVPTIRRIVKSLEDKELVIIDNFNSLPIDKTSWYRINYQKVEEIESVGIDSRKEHSTTQSEHSEYPKRVHEVPNLITPLPESTTEIHNNNAHANEIPETAFSFYEKNGFGILTPHVGEKVGDWIDETNEELVIHALKISVENSVPRWSYAESILKDWTNKKITNVQQVLAHDKREKVSSFAGKGQPVDEVFELDLSKGEDD